MTLDAYLTQLGFDPDSDEANRLLAWALDVDVEDLLDGLDEEGEALGEEEEMSDEEADAQILEALKLCIDSDPDWRQHASEFEVRDPYQVYLERLGIEPDSPQEVELLEAAFGISFDEDEPHGEGCSCGCGDDHSDEEIENLPEMESMELLAGVHAFLKANPGWKPRS